MHAGFIRAARHLEAARIAAFKQRHHHLFRGAGIGRAFEHNQLALVDVRRNGLDRAGHIAQVGLVVLVERRGHADDHRIHGGDLGVVGRGAEARLLHFRNGFGQNANDVGPARVERGHLIGRDVEAGDAETFARKKQGQRQSHIAHAHDSDAGLSGCKFLFECGEDGHGSIRHAVDCTASMQEHKSAAVTVSCSMVNSARWHMSESGAKGSGGYRFRLSCKAREIQKRQPALGE